VRCANASGGPVPYDEGRGATLSLRTDKRASAWGAAVATAKDEEQTSQVVPTLLSLLAQNDSEATPSRIALALRPVHE
jgi:hypothetical protein